MTEKTIYAPIAKVDREERMVYGYASTEAVDSQGEVVRKEALAAALPDYMRFANVREMHQPFLSDSGKGVAVAPGGSFIPFNNSSFLNAPVVHMSIVSVNGDTTGFWSAVDVSATGFTGHIFDHTGVDAGGVTDWSANT